MKTTDANLTFVHRSGAPTQRLFLRLPFDRINRAASEQMRQAARAAEAKDPPEA